MRAGLDLWIWMGFSALAVVAKALKPVRLRTAQSARRPSKLLAYVEEASADEEVGGMKS